MPAPDSPAIIVARYLKTNHPESYETFIAEAGLPYDAGTLRKGDLTLETLLEEKKTFDISVRFEKLGLEEENSGWTAPAPSIPHEIRVLPASSNILSACVASLEEENGSQRSTLLATTADRRVHLLDAHTKTLSNSSSPFYDSPVLSAQVFRHQFILTSSMSGHLHLSDSQGRVLDKRQDHSKYLVKVAILDDGLGDVYIATAGWDSKISIYKPDIESALKIGEPNATIPLSTKPEAMLILRHPDNGKPVILLSRTDSSFIFYYSIEDEPRLLGKQNLAPHSNAWVAFTPSALELCPTDPTLLAVGTSSVPHMKLLIVRLLFPPWEPETSRPDPTSVRASLLDESPAIETQASQARAALAVAEREDAAIQIHCTTMAPQTAYSTPAVAWRPDGSGVWVNGDDGAVRGIEASTGKVASTLHGHEAGSKVRCLWAGTVTTSGDEDKEILVSGGFDHKLIIWEE